MNLWLSCRFDEGRGKVRLGLLGHQGRWGWSSNIRLKLPHVTQEVARAQSKAQERHQVTASPSPDQQLRLPQRRSWVPMMQRRRQRDIWLGRGPCRTHHLREPTSSARQPTFAATTSERNLFCCIWQITVGFSGGMCAPFLEFTTIIAHETDRRIRHTFEQPPKQEQMNNFHPLASSLPPPGGTANMHSQLQEIQNNTDAQIRHEMDMTVAEAAQEARNSVNKILASTSTSSPNAHQLPHNFNDQKKFLLECVQSDIEKLIEARLEVTTGLVRTVREAVSDVRKRGLFIEHAAAEGQFEEAAYKAAEDIILARMVDGYYQRPLPKLIGRLTDIKINQLEALEGLQGQVEADDDPGMGTGKEKELELELEQQGGGVLFEVQEEEVRGGNDSEGEISGSNNGSDAQSAELF